ncbi:MAG: DHA2 family efflux MFS transporter permease subunit, partial [Solirubrobacteraceae bacterium]|nr:DHA2 family efflux MFS transporter permease subunit [Solirubrobacteraceae bacterium]
VVLGAIMSILDVTVVNVALRVLSEDFDSPLSTIQWVATGYTLALATVIPITGWAADRFGTKRLYMLSLGLFMLGSVAAGLAWSAESLIAFRVLQGFGGGMIMPAGMTILTRAAGPERLGRVMSIVGIPMLLGPIIGPILGGWLVDDVSWHWIFFINVPIGLLALFMAARILPRDVPAHQHTLDLRGLLLVSPGLAALVYGLSNSASAGGFTAPDVFGPIVAGLVLIALFVRHALRTDEPLVDMRLFTNRTFSAASGTLVLFAIAVFGAMLLLPLYLQTVRGESALTSGLLLAPQGIGALLTMPIAGLLTDRIGPGKIVLTGLPLVFLSLLGLTQLTADTSYWVLGGELFLMGMGMGMTMMPVMTGAMATLRSAAVARASTTLNVIQQVGASVGTATMAVLLTSAMPGDGGIEGGAESLADLPPAVVAKALDLMAEAYASTFGKALGIAMLALLPALLLPRRKITPAPPELDENGRPIEAAPVILAH